MMKLIATNPTSLLEALTTLCPSSSKSTLRSWIKEDRVQVNQNSNVIHSTMVQPGDVITVGAKKRFIDEQVELIYDDRDLIVVNKYEGLLTVASAFENEKTLHGLLKHHYRPCRIYPVHRLDQDASGVIVFAKNERAREGLKSIFEKHAIERTYYAIVEGVPEHTKGIWSSYQWEDANYCVHNSNDPSKGKEAITHYEVKSSKKSRALLEIKLETGRKNQIRAHCNWKGHPIVGDKKYGSKTNPGKRLCLHAYSLGFAHPISGAPLFFCAPLPPLFTQYL